MKLGGIACFELAYQARRPQTWLFLAAPAIAAFFFTRDGALADAVRDDFWINSPSAVAGATLVGCLLWLLIAPSVAGDAAARDSETHMDPLAYTVPVTRGEYLGGRFLAAFLLNALILLGTTFGSLLGAYLPGIPDAALGPFRPAAYLTAYGYIALPNAFLATAIQFSLAAISRRSRAAYLGSMGLFFFAYIVSVVVYWLLGKPDLARLVDPIGVITITEILPDWTPLEKRIRLLVLEGPLLWNRMLWIGLAFGALALARVRFTFAHHVERGWWSRVSRFTRRGGRFPARAEASAPGHAMFLAGMVFPPAGPIAVPPARRSDSTVTHWRQVLCLGRTAFGSIARSWAGLALLAGLPLFAILILPLQMEQLGVPLLPRTVKVLSLLTGPVTGILTPWVVVPLLILFHAGELVWSEREAGLSETVDATAVPDWVLLGGKLLGLSAVLALLVSLMVAAGMAIQALLGFDQIDQGLYLKVMFGLQLTEYLLFVVLAFAIHVVVDQKHIGHFVALFAYAVLIFAPMLGVEHKLAIYGASPAWFYTEMREFGGTVGPWLWFKVYWIAWALLLLVGTRSFWVRGREGGFVTRVRLAAQRLTRPTLRFAAVAAALIATLGGFVFYNTNVLNEYRSSAEVARLRAEYERRYRRYEAVPQPQRAGVELRVELYPERRAMTVNGRYRLVNRGAVPIDSIHIGLAPRLSVRALAFDRPARLVRSDDALSHRIYALGQPLGPGDTVQFDFAAEFAPRGFTNEGIAGDITPNATRLPLAGLPAIGYQRSREVTSARERRAFGLDPRPLILPSLHDSAAVHDATPRGGTQLTIIVGTSEDQTAVAPGTLRRTWTADGRRYFHYETSAPIGDEYGVYSARYAVREAEWTDPARPSARPVTIRLFHHPAHTATLDDMLRGAEASLAYFTTHFSPYGYDHLFLVETGGNGIGMHADASQLTFTEGFTSWHRDDDPRALDMPFAVVAHEMAHQWWPGQLAVALVEGAPFFSESLAWYSAMQVVRQHYGQDQLRRLMANMRQPNPWPRVRRGLPLLRADDPWTMYRRGPFTMIALSEYIGEDQVNTALRRMIDSSRARAGRPPLQTMLDLYRELAAVTPDSLRPLLRDLFEVNTVWEFETRRAAAEPIGRGRWRVTLEVEARKEMVDTAGVATPLAMDDPVEIGVFAPLETGSLERRVLHRETHRIRSGRQTITVVVPERPEFAGIDPYGLLDWEEGDDIEPVEIEE